MAEPPTPPTTGPDGEHDARSRLLELAYHELAAAHAIVVDPLAGTSAATSALHFIRAWRLLARSVTGSTPTDLPAWLEAVDLPELRPRNRARAVATLRGIVAITGGAGADETEFDNDDLIDQADHLRRIIAAVAGDQGGWSLQRQRQAMWLKRGTVAVLILLPLLYCSWLWWRETRPGRWRAAYYDNDGFAGRPVIRRERQIGYEWGGDAPLPDFPADDFSVRWDTCLHLDRPIKAAFQLVSNNDSRLLVDGDLALHNWNNNGQRTRGGWYDLSAGVHHLRVEYREGRKTANIWFLASFGEEPPDHIPAAMLSFPRGESDDHPCR